MTTATLADVPALKARFEEDGFVILPGVLAPGVVAGVRRELELLVDRHAAKLIGDGLINDAHQSEPFDRRYYALYRGCMDRAPRTMRAELHLPGMFDLFFHPVLLDVAESILGPEVRLYPNYSVRPKMPDHKATEVLWHQDGAYTEKVNVKVGDLGVDALRMVNVWTPLVPARVENGCMQFVPGTHKLGVVPHGRGEHYLEIAPASLEPHLSRAIDLELDPGDVVIFHNLLFHRGLPNRADTVRWSCDWRYQDATQPTLRKYNGHLGRSRAHPDKVVRSAEAWAKLKFE